MENGEKLQTHINEEVQETLKKHEDHLAIANKEMGEIKVSLSEVKNNIDWLKNFFWVIAGSSIGGLITGVFNLILK